MKGSHTAIKNIGEIIMKPTNVFMLILLILLSSSCEKPLAPPPVAPATTITAGPAAGETVTVDSVTFVWAATGDAGSYSYRFDSDVWSDWTTITSATFGYLDEGSHTFSVRSRHTNGVTIEQNPPTRTFTVDAVKGQSVMFLPRLKIVTNSQRFTYDVKAEEVVGLLAAKITIGYNRSVLRIDSIQFGSFVAVNGGNAVQFPSVNSVDNVNGKAVINLGIAGGSPRGITGSGVIATLFCRALAAGTIELSFDSSGTEYRDTANAQIPLRDLINGRLEVQ